MDRNFNLQSTNLLSLVALRKESVDRNNPLEALIILPKQSLSARRAWIEIITSKQSM